MLSDLRRQADVVQIKSVDDNEAAKQLGVVGFLPTLEHLAISKELHRLDILDHMGIRLAGVTYTRKHDIGDGQYERHDGGLSDFGIAVVRRMNDLGMMRFARCSRSRRGPPGRAARYPSIFAPPSM